MAKPTVYKWTDAGAPQITRGDKDKYQALFQAVLIDGYGTKTPPVDGLNKWSIPFSNATGFVLKQGGTQSRKTCIKLYDFYSGGYYAKFQCATDYSDINTPITPWTSGSNDDRTPMGYSNNNTYNIPWVIVATERAMYCQFGQNYNQVNVTAFDTNYDANNQYLYNYHWFFGDYVPEIPELIVNQCISAVNYSSTNNSYYTQSLTYSNNTTSYGYKRCAGNVANITGEYDCIPFFNRPITMSSTNPGSKRSANDIPRYPNALNGALYLDKVKILSARNIVGQFPGLLFPIQQQPFPINGNIYEFDGAGDYAGSKILVFGTYDGQYMLHLGDWGIE